MKERPRNGGKKHKIRRKKEIGDKKIGMPDTNIGGWNRSRWIDPRWGGGGKHEKAWQEGEIEEEKERGG